MNYVYRLEDVERNHEWYTKQYKIMASHHIEWMAKRSVLGTETAIRTAPSSTPPFELAAS